MQYRALQFGTGSQLINSILTPFQKCTLACETSCGCTVPAWLACCVMLTQPTRNLGGSAYECDNDGYHCVFRGGHNRGHCHWDLVVYEEPAHQRTALEVRA